MRPHWILLAPLLASVRSPLGEDPAAPPPAAPPPAVAPAGSLESRVRAAVERGREALFPRLAALVKEPPSDYPVGRIAVCATALLKAGASADDPRIAAAFDKLGALAVEKTYCAAVYLFALDALWKAELKPLEAAEKPGPRATSMSRKPPPAPTATAQAARQRIGVLVDWLVKARLTKHGSWTYERPDQRPRHDFSNTQFAVLGLQIGREHGCKIPREVFVDLARLFTGAMTPDGALEELEVTPEMPLETRLGLTSVKATRRRRVVAGGWGYTDPRQGRGEKDAPYPSMTAAGASSLLVALEALREPGSRLTREEEKLVLGADEAVHGAYLWIARHFDLFLKEPRGLTYTLYSLEKVGDLGRLERFGAHDWYREGAERLLAEQKPGGSWGTYSDTALALLFLTRATRRVVASPAPAIVTAARDDGQLARAADLVYIERAKGFLSASALLAYAGETRRPELVPVLEEAVRNYAPDLRDELAEPLLGLWTVSDRISAFAQKALRGISGAPATTRKEVEAWIEELKRVRTLEARAELRPDDLAVELASLCAPGLKGRLAALAHRRGWKRLAGALVTEMQASTDPELRRKLHGILLLWTGQAIPTPAGPDPKAWQATAAAWQDWWRASGEEWLRKLDAGGG